MYCVSSDIILRKKTVLQTVTLYGYSKKTTKKNCTCYLATIKIIVEDLGAERVCFYLMLYIVISFTAQTSTHVGLGGCYKGKGNLKNK